MEAIRMGDLAIFAGAPAHRFADGNRTTCAFYRPFALCTTSHGEVYVSDTGNHRIRFINKYGNVSTYAGDGTIGLVNGNAEKAKFNYPSGLCRWTHGQLLISDSANHVIRVIGVNKIVKTFAGTGQSGDHDGPCDQATFNLPLELCVDHNSHVYICDSNNHRIRMINAQKQVSTVCGSVKGYKDGPKDEALFNSPSCIRIAPSRLGSLIISDSSNHCIRILNNGYITTFSGKPDSPGFGVGSKSETLFRKPISIAFGPDETVYVSDASNHCVYAIDPSNGQSYVLSGGNPGCQDGNKERAAFTRPGGICMASQNQLIMTETGNGRILFIRRDGSVLSFAGTPKASVDGLAHNASFGEPFCLFSASSSDLVVSDSKLNSIRRIKNGVVSTFAGCPEKGCTNGRRDISSFSVPTGVCISSSNVVYVADMGNHVIRQIQDGHVSTIAGTGQAGYADGQADQAMFNAPCSVSVTSNGSVLIADSNNQRIRLLSKDTAIHTFAGSGQIGFHDGPRLEASFHSPSAVLYSSQGLIFVTDRGNNAIRLIGTNGHVSTVCGIGTRGYKDGIKSEATFNQPTSCILTPDGKLLVADTGNKCIRLVKSDGSVSTFIYSDPFAWDMKLNFHNHHHGDSMSTDEIPNHHLHQQNHSTNSSSNSPQSHHGSLSKSTIDNSLVPVPTSLSLTTSGVLFVTDTCRGQILYLPCPQWDQSRQIPNAKDFHYTFSLEALRTCPQPLFDMNITHALTGQIFHLHQFIVSARCPILLTDPAILQMIESTPSKEAINLLLRLIYSEQISSMPTLPSLLSLLELLRICLAINKPSWIALVKLQLHDLLGTLSHLNSHGSNRSSFSLLSPTDLSSMSIDETSPAAAGLIAATSSINPNSNSSFHNNLQQHLEHCMEALVHINIHCEGNETLECLMMEHIKCHIVNASEPSTGSSTESRRFSIGESPRSSVQRIKVRLGRSGSGSRGNLAAPNSTQHPPPSTNSNTMDTPTPNHSTSSSQSIGHAPAITLQVPKIDTNAMNEDDPNPLFAAPQISPRQVVHSPRRFVPDFSKFNQYPFIVDSVRSTFLAVDCSESAPASIQLPMDDSSSPHQSVHVSSPSSSSSSVNNADSYEWSLGSDMAKLWAFVTFTPYEPPSGSLNTSPTLGFSKHHGSQMQSYPSSTSSKTTGHIPSPHSSSPPTTNHVGSAPIAIHSRRKSSPPRRSIPSPTMALSSAMSPRYHLSTLSISNTNSSPTGLPSALAYIPSPGSNSPQGMMGSHSGASPPPTKISSPLSSSGGRPTSSNPFQFTSPTQHSDNNHNNKTSFGFSMNRSSTAQSFEPDFFINVGDTKFACHKLVLYARWPYFAKLVQNSFQQHVNGLLDNCELDIRDSPMTPEIMHNLLKYLYTQEIVLQPHDETVALNLLKCALLYEFVIAGEFSNRPNPGFELLITSCRSFLLKPITISNCSDILISLYEYGSSTQQNRLIAFIARNLKQIMSDPNSAKTLSYLTAELHTKIMYCHFHMAHILEEDTE